MSQCLCKQTHNTNTYTDSQDFYLGNCFLIYWAWYFDYQRDNEIFWILLYFIFIRKTKNEIGQTGMLSTMSIFSTIWLYIFDESSGEGSEVVGHKKKVKMAQTFLLDRSLLQQCYIMIAFSADIPRFSCLHEADDKAP